MFRSLKNKEEKINWFKNRKTNKKELESFFL